VARTDSAEVARALDRKALIREYKESPRPAGVFGVRNVETGRLLVGATPNLPGMLNRQRFQLEMGSHPDKELQADWDALGPDAFAFEVLDKLEQLDDPGADQAADLDTLRVVWLERLEEQGGAPYPMSRRGL